MVTTKNDPILDALGHRDPHLLVQVLHELLLSEEGASATALYAGLPEQLLRELAAAGGPLRSLIASREDCPEDVLRELSQDRDDEVRRSVAGNESTPQSVLTRLAADANQWVRRDAYLNPTSSRETQEVAQRSSDVGDLEGGSLEAEADPRTPPEVLRKLALENLSDPNAMAVRSTLAENPSLPEDVIPALVEAAWYRWEWRSLWSRNSGFGGMGPIWPSTVAFTNPTTPDWVVTALAEAGHPAALLRTDLRVSRTSVGGPAGVIQLVNSELLVRALWRELALAGAVELAYWRDSLEGDQFFPQSPSIEDLMEPHTAAAYLIGGYSESREWIETTDVLTVDNITHVAANQFESWAESVEDYSTADLDLFTLAGAAYAVENFSGRVALTLDGHRAMSSLGTDGFYFESDDFDTHVTIRDSNLPFIGYADTVEGQKQALVALIVSSRADVMIDAWGLASHFLKCIALHPHTPERIRASLSTDPDASVRKAVQAGTGGAQSGLVPVVAGPGTAPNSAEVAKGSDINSFVFSILIPAGRFEEGRIWLQECIDLEIPYESWNARSNMGVIEFLMGYEAEARRQFAMVLASEDGPTFEAAEYLQRLDSGEVPPVIPRVSYSEEWRQPPVSSFEGDGSEQRMLYMRALRLLADPDQVPASPEAWAENRGAFATAFLDAAFPPETTTESSMEREIVAKALVDYYEHVLLELPSSEDSGGLGALRLAEGDRGEAERLLRRAASRGDSRAALLLGTLLTTTGRDRQGQAWLKVAQRA